MSYGYILPDKGSGATSGPVRTSYFDPDTGEPVAEKPKPREGKQRLRGCFAWPPEPTHAVGLTVDGRHYDSMHLACIGEGFSKSTLQAARKSGCATVKGKRIVFDEVHGDGS